MRGRKPKPIEQQIAEGDPGKFGKAKLEARLEKRPRTCDSIPDCPKGLSRVGREAWEFWTEELEGMNLAARCDAKFLEMACVEFATYAKADAAIHKLGEVIEEQIFSRNGDPVGLRMKRNPWLDVRNRAFLNVGKFTSEFGLSPVSRTRLTIENPDDGMAELEAILRGPRLTDEEREKAMQ
jgi:P27 family predicted phage terminase small subunit